MVPGRNPLLALPPGLYLRLGGVTSAARQTGDLRGGAEWSLRVAGGLPLGVTRREGVVLYCGGGVGVVVSGGGNDVGNSVDIPSVSSRVINLVPFIASKKQH